MKSTVIGLAVLMLAAPGICTNDHAAACNSGAGNLTFRSADVVFAPGRGDACQQVDGH